MNSGLELLGLLLYGATTWWLGFSVRKHYLVLQHIRRTRAELQPGFTLSQKGFEMHRSSTVRVWSFSIIILLMGILLAIILYTPENRLSYNLGAVIVPFVLPFLGLMGQIPVPGISIKG